jgi:hypothetical protein
VDSEIDLDTIQPREALEALHAQAQAQGVKSSLDLIDPKDPWWTPEYPGSVSLELQSGREPRRVTVEGSRVLGLLGLPLDQIVFCGDLGAFANRESGVIEAAVIGAGRTPTSFSRAVDLTDLPGVEPIETDESVSEEDLGERPRKQWRLSLVSGDKELELSPMSAAGQALLQSGTRSVSLKMSGFDVSRHDDTVETLQRYAGSLFFDMDLLYNVQLSVPVRREVRRRGGAGRANHPMEFPLNDYPPDALSLYRYGRSSAGLPLLEFLSYYQALENFFPAFAHEETARSLRTYLLDPRHKPDQDATINAIIRLAAPAVHAGVGERAQLRATVRAVVSDEGLREVLSQVDPKGDVFVAKKQRIKGVSVVNLQNGDLRDQVADRIYTIRCRIVHTKQDGGAANTDLLLPSSREATELGPDIAVLRHIAQQAIVARAKRAP